MSDQYAIQFTNTTAGALLLDPYHVDGPVHANVVSPPFTNGGYPAQHTVPSTSLVFYGKGIYNYGPRIQQNFLNLLENFSSPNRPVNPISGQLWYDSALKHMQVFTGSDWVSVLDGSTGGTVNGQVLILEYPTDPNHIATKAYVDGVSSLTVSGIFSLIGDYNNTNKLLNVTLVKDNVNISGISVHIPSTIDTIHTSFNSGVLTTALGTGSNSNTNIADTISSSYDSNTSTLTTALGSGASTNVVIPNVIAPIQQNIILTTSDTYIINVLPYTVGYNRLWIFKNGIKQYMGVNDDYIETDSVTITFNTLIPNGTKFEVLHL